MKKIALLLISLMAIYFGGFSQQTPEFSFELYVEDAAGNKDTVTLGYDPKAADSIDPYFDSENILDVPWGDDLDVRVGDVGYHYDLWYYVFDYENPDTLTFLTKRKIIRRSCLSSPISNPRGRLSVHIYTDSLPLILRWDKTPFIGDDNPYITNCREVTCFFGEIDYLNFDVTVHYFLQVNDSMVIVKSSFSEERYQTEPDSFIYFRDYSSEGKKIIVIQFIFEGRGINSSTPFYDNESVYNIYPNPIQKGENLNLDFVGDYSLFNLQGKLIKTGEVQNKQIPTNELQKGMYLLRLENDKTHYQTKIIVQ